MKGIVFTEFLDLVEDKFGFEMVDTIINNSNLPSNGSYTAVGTYSFSEMLSLLTNLNKETGIPVNDLLLLYGEHFFSVVEKSYSSTNGHLHEKRRQGKKLNVFLKKNPKNFILNLKS